MVVPGGRPCPTAASRVAVEILVAAGATRARTASNDNPASRNGRSLAPIILRALSGMPDLRPRTQIGTLIARIAACPLGALVNFTSHSIFLSIWPSPARQGRPCASLFDGRGIGRLRSTALRQRVLRDIPGIAGFAVTQIVGGIF